MSRSTVTCSQCLILKPHFGLGMCSACLRNYKRKTRPSFYLGTCYSEMSRRVKKFDPKRPNYFGKKICTKREFVNRFLNDGEFLTLYKNWQDSGFKRGEAPSIDRVDNNGDYIIDNMRFIVHWSNMKKDWQYPVFILKGETTVGEFESQLAAAEFLGCSAALVCKSIKEDKTIYGYRIIRK